MAVLALVVASAPAAADEAAGRPAFEEGDCVRRIAELQTAAKKDPEVQFGLGQLYEFGACGLAQDYQRAADLYQKAARKGNVEAEYRLSLIFATGGENLSSDLAEAEKWADLAAQSDSVWGRLADNFKKLLHQQVVTPGEQAEGKKRAAAWTESLAAPPPAPPSPGNSVGCPGWPFPSLPCNHPLPPFPGPPEPPPSAKPPEAKPSLAELNAALARIDCASVHARTEADGAAIVTGTVPDKEQKANLLPQLVARYFPTGRNDIEVDIVPPPICRTLVALDRMKPADGTAKGELLLRLYNGSSRLRQGDPISLQVHGPDYPVNLRIDYFSLDGSVSHLKPRGEEPPPKLAAATTELFRDAATAGGAPFGTELIAVVATPVPLDLGQRDDTEAATGYLRDLEKAFGRIGSGSGHPGLVATLLVETSGG